MKVLSVVGARPQFIKCAPLSREIRRRFDEVLVHTGQHYDAGMSDVFFEELQIPRPDYHLGVGSGMHAAQTGAMLARIEEVLQSEVPDLVLVYGDTNSTLAGALAAAKLHVPVAHVEAGLRSFDRAMPEEVNRVVVDHVSSLLFCPTRTAVENLEREGIRDGVRVTGDVMVDAVEFNRVLADEQSDVMERFGLAAGKYAVMTVHRASNTDDPAMLGAILGAVGEAGLPVVFPVHPRTRQAMAAHGLALPANILAVEPLGYLDMLRLLGSARRLLTDSGGMQKEAFVLGVPCVTLRDTTEWVETVELGWNVLAGTDRGAILAGIGRPEPTGPRMPVYGDGRASGKVVAAIADFFSLKLPGGSTLLEILCQEIPDQRPDKDGVRAVRQELPDRRPRLADEKPDLHQGGEPVRDAGRDPGADVPERRDQGDAQHTSRHEPAGRREGVDVVPAEPGEVMADHHRVSERDVPDRHGGDHEVHLGEVGPEDRPE